MFAATATVLELDANERKLLRAILDAVPLDTSASYRARLLAEENFEIPGNPSADGVVLLAAFIEDLMEALK